MGEGKARELRIWIHSEDAAPTSRPILGDRGLVGRGEHCEIHLPDPTVSGDHLELARRGESWIATDLDSRNGTVLNGKALGRPTRLKRGDVLTIGPYRLEVAIADPGPSTVKASPRQIRLTEDERATAAALVIQYRADDVAAPRPATRAEVATALHISERTVQRRLDALATKLGIPPGGGRERPREIAEHVLAFGLDR